MNRSATHAKLLENHQQGLGTCGVASWQGSLGAVGSYIILGPTTPRDTPESGRRATGNQLGASNVRAYVTTSYPE